MADLLEKLWPAFVSEVTEQLDSVELLLAKSGAAASVDVNHLFRSFHTIKGNCSMIGFTSMEVLAHRSEDILAEVRNGDIEMDDSVIDILLESITRLKKQFNQANETRENPPQDDELVEKLTSFVNEKLGIDESVEEQASGEAAQADLEGLSTAAKVAVPSLVLGLDAAAKADKVETAVSMLSTKAKELGFKALSRSLNHFIATVKSDVEHKHSHLIEIAAEVFNDIEFICAEHNVDLSLEMGSKLCKSKLTLPYSEELGILNSLLSELHTTPPDTWEVDQFLKLVDHATSLGNYCSLFRYAELNACWRYIKQLVVEVSRGYILFNSDIVEKLFVIVELARQGDGAPDFDNACKEALEDLQFTTAKFNNERDEIVDTKNAIVEKSSLCFDSMVDLKIDVLEKINSAIDDGMLAVEIDIDFSDEETSEKVLTAVRNIGELAHSRTMFHDLVNGVAQRTSFAFLILTQKSLEDVDKVLSIIDRGKGTYTILGQEEESSGNESEQSELKSTEKNQIEANDQSVDEVEETEELVNETSMSMNSLKVEGQDVDKLISEVGELITHHNRLAHFVTQDDHLTHLSYLKNSPAIRSNPTLMAAVNFLEDSHTQTLAANENLQASLNRIQNDVLGLRVVPIAYAFNRFHKFVRTISQKLGKKVVLDVIGEQVKVDKGMIDVLSEPLAHMVRNSIDHGIEDAELRKEAGKDEFGLVKLKAEQESGMVIIEIIDDGGGLDRDKILEKCIKQDMLQAGVEYSDQEIFKNIFEPGFSTSDQISETSGRGVGMDVVKSKIVEVGGSVHVDSELGKGTTIQLRLPISAAIQSVILVGNSGQTLALPERYIVEVLSLKATDVQTIQGQSAMMLRNNIVPLYRLDKLMHSDKTRLDSQQDEYEVVILSNDQHMAGLVVDETMGRVEVLVRDTHESLKFMTGNIRGGYFR